MVRLPLLDSDETECNCTRRCVECHVNGFSGTRMSRSFAEPDRCTWNSVGTDMCAYDVAKVYTWLEIKYR